MNISSATSAASASYRSSTGLSDTAALEKQKAQLQAELEKAQSGKDDEKTKEAKTKQLQQQIKQIEAQIAQKQQSGASGASGPSGVGSAGAPPDNPAGGQALAAAGAQQIATATTDSVGRFDIRI